MGNQGSGWQINDDIDLLDVDNDEDNEKNNGINIQLQRGDIDEAIGFADHFRAIEEVKEEVKGPVIAVEQIDE